MQGHTKRSRHNQITHGVTHCNATFEMRKTQLVVQRYSQLHSELNAILDYMNVSQKERNN